MLISIVVCVLNRENDIKRVIDSLVSQDYQNIEVILVDNGSTDSTLKIINECKNEKVKLIDGSEFKGSPYSARNLGIKSSNGNIIAFMDGYPAIDWVSKGVDAFQDKESHIIAGKVDIIVNKNSSLYEIYDSIFSLDIDYMVSKYKVAPTANLFIKSSLFEALGMFDNNIRSGGDILFTSNAAKSGYLINFCKEAKSSYFARDRNKLIDKQKRIAKGQVNIWRKKNKVSFEILKTIIKFFIPFNPIEIYNRIKSNSSIELSYFQIIQLYIIKHKLDRIRLFSTLVESIKGIQK